MPPARVISLSILVFIAMAGNTRAQEPASEHHEIHAVTNQQEEHEHSSTTDDRMGMNDAGRFLMRQSSGTAIQPASAKVPMWMQPEGAWNLMFHGTLFISDIQQSGPRGADKFVSTNWFMGMAERSVGKGSFMLRSMISLDPLTVTKRRYPELFQTGELAFGRPIIDGQHPHDLLMEFAAQYALPIGKSAIFSTYFAPVGDPALGPVSFPHRLSSEALPQATLGHHLQDATHIANNVLTAGIARGIFRLEASGFRGQEPNENRWNIDYGAIDSWSARLTLSPGRNWNGQVSVGRLSDPEPLEPGDIVRSTASLHYNRPFSNGVWTTSLIWGRNHQTETKQNLNSYLAESLVQLSGANYVTGRLELVDKNELFDDDHDSDGHGTVQKIAAYTFGYTRGLGSRKRIGAALGATISLYTLPAELHHFYGDSPVSIAIFLRLRPAMP